MKKNGVKTFADIKDKKLAIGSLHSGTRFTAARIWQAPGFERLRTENFKLLSRRRSIAALENGEVDVIIIAGAIPDVGIQKLTQRNKDVRFIPVPQTIISKLVEQNFAYYGHHIPANTYPRQKESVLSLGMTALLVTSKHTEDKAVDQFMRMMQEGSEEISQQFYRADFISNKTARLGISMPLHRAAEKFYKEIQREERNREVSSTVDDK